MAKATVHDKTTDLLVRHFGDELHGLGLRGFAKLHELAEAGVPLDEAYALAVMSHRTPEEQERAHSAWN